MISIRYNKKNRYTKKLSDNSSIIKKTAQKTLELESKAIKLLNDSIDSTFISVVNLINNSKGRVVITGIGKSGLIAMKIAATLNSTGTSAIFMHAADAIHGDLGVIKKDDTIICLSKSGDSKEIKELIPSIKIKKNTIVAITSEKNSFLSSESNFTIITPIEREACPNNLAPTTSTTAQLAIGDALAMSLLVLKDFNKEDFAMVHPGGILGKRLTKKTSDFISPNQKPYVKKSTKITEVIIEITKKRLGATAVIENDQIVGIITDGDIRRMLEKNEKFNHLLAENVMTFNPIIVSSETLAVEALRIMEEKKIGQLIIINSNKEYIGIIHILDLIKEGISI